MAGKVGQGTLGFGEMRQSEAGAVCLVLVCPGAVRQAGYGNPRWDGAWHGAAGALRLGLLGRDKARQAVLGAVGKVKLGALWRD
jgi:hypothetical protein